MVRQGRARFLRSERCIIISKTVAQQKKSGLYLNIHVQFQNNSIADAMGNLNHVIINVKEYHKMSYFKLNINISLFSVNTDTELLTEHKLLQVI